MYITHLRYHKKISNTPLNFAYKLSTYVLIKFKVALKS
jgi:hypothetical protein